MITRIIAFVVILTFLASNLSCSRNVAIDLAKQKPDWDEKIISVIKPTGEEIVFSSEGGWIDPEKECICGMTESEEIVSIPLDDVYYLKVRRFDATKSVIATICILAVAVGVGAALIAALKESCPFIYSYDGSRYMLDAEPLGGAICHGLRRTDYCRLDHLVPHEGRYRLLVQNEVNEIQHLDELALLVFDHSPDVEVISDFAGGFHAVSSSIPPARATDESGNDLRKFFAASDGIAWQSRMPRNASQKPSQLRHELTLTFPKPENASSARLIVNAGATLWASNMIRETVALGGTAVADWYRALEEDGPGRTALKAFLLRDEPLHLCVMAATQSGWNAKGFIRSGGPLVIEDQIIPLDLSDVSGDSLSLRLRPPFSFWSIDRIAVSYETDADVLFPDFELPVLNATDDRAGDVTSLLLTSDDVDYVMDLVGDRAEVVFDAPPQEAGTVRTVFVLSSGYYEIQLPEVQLDERDKLAAIARTPDACTEFSIEKYQEWIASFRAVN